MNALTNESLDSMDEATRMRALAQHRIVLPVVCPPCNGNCTQGRECPADESGDADAAFWKVQAACFLIIAAAAMVAVFWPFGGAQ